MTITGKTLKIVQFVILYYFLFHMFACGFYYIGLKESIDEADLEVMGTNIKIPTFGWFNRKQTIFGLNSFH
jgi:hypothetical protein